MASIVNSSGCTVSSMCKECKGDLPHIVCISIVILFGLLCNSLLLYATFKSWKLNNKSPDKICIFNFCTSNIVVIMVGLPLRIIVLVLYTDETALCDVVVTMRSLEEGFWVSCMFVSMSVLAVIAFDRFESLTKFPHQRRLNIRRSIIVTALLWAIALIVGIAFYTTFPTQCRIEESIQIPNEKVGMPRIVKQMVIAVLIGLSCERCARYLILATKRIHQHREQINSRLGHRLANIEVSFTKSVIAFCISNAVLVVPLIVVSVVFGTRRDVNMKCFSQWLGTSLYLGFVHSPVIYFTVDKRMRIHLLGRASSSKVAVNEKNQTSSQIGVSSRQESQTAS